MMLSNRPDISQIKMVRFNQDYVQCENMLNDLVKDLDTIHDRIHRPYFLTEMINDEFYLFLKDNNLLGYTLLYPKNNKSEYIIKNFLIREKFRGQGYGSACFQILLNYLKYKLRVTKVFLKVNAKNKIAKDLYTGYGFIKVDTEVTEKMFLRL